MGFFHAADLIPGDRILSVLAACPAKQAPGVPTIAADTPDARHKASEIRKGIWRYTTRGAIARLPANTGLAQDLAIHHEALPEFHNQDGANVGMVSMEMDFPSIAPGVSLEGLATGDIVVFDFEVDWKSRDVWTVTRLAKLPQETKLNFGPAQDKEGLDASASPPK
jgi:hypothetical protein